MEILSRRSIVLTGVQLIAPIMHAVEFYVSPVGNDANLGTEANPLASLAAARDRVRALAGREQVTVHVADGIYYLPDTLVFTPEDSGAAATPVVYRAQNEGGAVLSGGSNLELDWKPYRDGIYRAKTPTGLHLDQLFIDGERQHMARYPNYDPSKKAEAYQGFSADAFAKERVDRWANPAGGFIHAMHRSRWGGYHYLITGKDAAGEVTYEGGWQNNRQMGMHQNFRMVENIFEELDAPGEWFHDQSTDLLYFLPATIVDLSKAKVEVVRLGHLVEFRGSETSPVKHVTLQGFVVRHAARTFMETKEPLLRSDWAIYRGGAFLLTGTEDVSILDTEFDQVGGNAIFVNNYNRRTLVKGCHIHDAGASGVCFVGDPAAVRNPLFEYGEKNDLATIDRLPGPRSNNYPADGVVADCLIHGIGRVERQPAGVQISMSMGITVRDASIYDCARAGINIGDGTWGGHLIERCDVFDTVLETHDHGSFNSWGRDRYWRSDYTEASQAAVDAEPVLPFLDAIKTTVIRDSRWRCDHGWDIDLDDGSSNYDIYNNLMLNGGLKFREGFRRRAWNNITVNNGFHPHVWFNHSNDEVYANIFMNRHKDILMAYSGKRIDGNLFFSGDPTVREMKTNLGWDQNSIVADPLFEDAVSGDFRVKAGSPAWEIGFTNFPMDQFGVKKPSLRTIARTPIIPPLRVTIIKSGSPESAASFSPPRAWRGVKIQDLQGEGFSAYGVSQEVGGIAVTAADRDEPNGLRAGDLIQGVNGRAVSTIRQFLQAVADGGSAPLKLKVIRFQGVVEVALRNP